MEPSPPCAQAPGSGVLAAYVGSSNTATTKMSGTSMAAPHVSGVAAQLLGADSTLSVARVKEMILAAAELNYISGVPSGTPNRFLIGGAGRHSTRDARALTPGRDPGPGRGGPHACLSLCASPSAVARRPSPRATRARPGRRAGRGGRENRNGEIL